MELQLLFCTGRSACFALRDGGLYRTLRTYRMTLNGKEQGTTDLSITSLYGLWPDTAYELAVYLDDALVGSLCFRTEKESVSLDVRRFGAIGDGLNDDTAAIQSAIACCPPKGRVRIPKGTYLVGPLFLKSHIRLELAQGAELLLLTDRSRFPILPGMTQSTDETGEYNLGSWEGNPLDMYAALLTGVDVEDVAVYGPGLINGQAEKGDWWINQKVRRGAWRPRLLYLCRCKDISIQGLFFQNSPAWNLHPYFSRNLRFLDIHVNAPANSPNTDGFDPESCENVLVAGAHFSLGDDCIALKSGKLYMGRTYQTPCQNIEIMHCLMENGHGGVTIGSEMAGGVQNVRVHDCLMRHTDRGLRIKTRRGRGKDGVIDDIRFKRVRMEQVLSPIVANCMYFCDPDGHSPYVQSREKQPVDERTPRIGHLSFENVEATGCGACAGYFLGLPEKPIEKITLRHVAFQYAQDAQPMAPAMAESVEECLQRGLIVKNVSSLVCEDVRLEGQQGEKLDQENVAQVEWR